MLIFIDTEFTGLEQENPSLISLALVRDDGDYFYAELPPASYLHRVMPWLRDNVLPLLWGGSYRVPVAELPVRVTAWIETIKGRTTVVTDAPEFDFSFLRALLDVWPRNLESRPIRFDSLALGESNRESLEIFRGEYYTPDKPGHHALHDVMALRCAWQRAQELDGWAAYAARVGLQ